MHFTSRVLSELERGLIGQLRFSFHGLGTRELRQLRIGDPVTFEIRVNNGSGLSLIELRGTVSHGERTRFPARSFEIRRLGPRAAERVAVVEGVFRGPVDPRLVDCGLASIAVSTRVDLSEMLFEEWNKQVVIAPEASTLGAPRPRPSRRPVFGKAIPLSAD